MRLAVADVPEVLRLVVGAAGEADRDPGGNAEIAEHERHGTREVLAIAGVRPRDESHQRRRAPDGPALPRQLEEAPRLAFLNRLQSAGRGLGPAAGR